MASEQTTTEAMTIEQTTTEAMTTEQTTTEAMTTEQATTEAMTTEQVTTEAMITEQVTTEAVTTEQATTEVMTTEQVITEAMITEQVTTETVSTEQATTEAVTTEQVTTEALTTEQVTTEALTTEQTTETITTTLTPPTEELTTTEQVTTQYVTEAPILETTTEIPVEETTTQKVTVKPTSEVPVTDAPTEAPTVAPTELPTTEMSADFTTPSFDVQQNTTFLTTTSPIFQETTTESGLTTVLLPNIEVNTVFPIDQIVSVPPPINTIFVASVSSSSSSGSSSSSTSGDSSISSGPSSPWGALVPIWNAFPVLGIAALIIASPFLLLLTVLFIGTPFGRSIDGGGDLLLGLFNDLYEDRTLDHPWLIAKILSQMFPEEFNPSSSEERMVLTKYVAKMFPEQLESLQNWKELSIPSVLIHLIPEKFAQVDYKHLDKYLTDDTIDYTETGNLRLLMLRFLTAAKDNLPELAQKYITPEVEEKLRVIVKNSDLISKLKDVIPDSSHLDNEWLFDRLMFKIKNFKKFDEEIAGSAPTEPTTQGTTQAETRPTTTSASPTAKCQWGPILCSINRVSFQRNADKRRDVDPGKIKEIVSSKPKNVECN